MSRNLVFVDTETTGLDPTIHEVVEVAWAVNDEPVRSVVLPHRFQNPDAKALAVNGYIARGLYDPACWASADELDELKVALTGCTLVGANPRFDAAFLASFHMLRSEPWHYRLLDIQAYGMAALRLDEMPGVADLVRLLQERGYTVPESDHTAAADVTATRAVFHLLRAEVGL